MESGLATEQKFDDGVLVVVAKHTRHGHTNLKIHFPTIIVISYVVNQLLFLACF